MPKGVPNQKYTAEFKQEVIETMQREHLSYAETADRFQIRHTRVQDWERIYLTYGVEGFRLERRGRGGKGAPPKLSKTVEEDLLVEVQRLRAENDYLKNLQAWVLEDERQQRKKHW
jgi:transposase-like protein